MTRPKKALGKATSHGEPEGAGDAAGVLADEPQAIDERAAVSATPAGSEVMDGEDEDHDEHNAVPQHDEQPHDDEPLPDDEQPDCGRPVPTPDPVLSVRLSKQLHARLIRTAHEEGVSVEALAQELLAEGVTLRAWEIIERKGAMRGLAPSGPPPGPGNGRGYGTSQGPHNQRQGNQGRGGPGGNMSSNNRNGQGNQGRRPGPGPGNNAWMEDKAAFLEYVRNQEKRRR